MVLNTVVQSEELDCAQTVKLFGCESWSCTHATMHMPLKHLVALMIRVVYTSRPGTLVGSHLLITVIYAKNHSVPGQMSPSKCFSFSYSCTLHSEILCV